MGYIAVKGGEEAVLNAEKVIEYYRCRGRENPIRVDQIREQMRLAVDRVMGEGSLYAPKLAALALKQAEGDVLEAAHLLRAFRSTVPRIGYTVAIGTQEMIHIRRISSAFQDIPGGQILGPTRDYTLRLLRLELLEEAQFQPGSTRSSSGLACEPLERVIDYLRREGLLEDRRASYASAPYDITREPLTFPADRAARLQRLARGEEGAMLMLAYSSMRGWGLWHPTLAEVRVGYLAVKIKHPLWGTEVVIGRIMVTETVAVFHFTRSPKELARGQKITHVFQLGYGLVFGHNERKSISMAILDRSLAQAEAVYPVEDQEFVLSHIDGSESQGFLTHLKLPHYVTFQSSLDRLRKIKEVEKVAEEVLCKRG